MATNSKHAEEGREQQQILTVNYLEEDNHISEYIVNVTTLISYSTAYLHYMPLECPNSKYGMLF